MEPEAKPPEQGKAGTALLSWVVNILRQEIGMKWLPIAFSHATSRLVQSRTADAVLGHDIHALVTENRPPLSGT